MGKRKRRQQQVPRRKLSAAQLVKPQLNARDATLAQSLNEAASPAGRAKTRQYIEQCGSPVRAAKGIYDAYVNAADKRPPGSPHIACRSGCWFCCTIAGGSREAQHLHTIPNKIRLFHEWFVG